MDKLLEIIGNINSNIESVSNNEMRKILYTQKKEILSYLNLFTKSILEKTKYIYKIVEKKATDNPKLKEDVKNKSAQIAYILGLSILLTSNIVIEKNKVESAPFVLENLDFSNLLDNDWYEKTIQEINEKCEKLNKDKSNAGSGIADVITEALRKEVDITKSSIEEERKYYDFPCSTELQDYIFHKSEETGIPYEISMTILDQESDGLWDANGKISPTNDYGYAQINKCNHATIYRDLGISTEELLYDPYKAIDAQFYMLQSFMIEYGYTPESLKNDLDKYKNMFGTYNGWTSWWKNQNACEYADSCMQRLAKHFGDELNLVR